MDNGCPEDNGCPIRQVMLHRNTCPTDSISGDR